MIVSIIGFTFLWENPLPDMSTKKRRNISVYRVRCSTELLFHSLACCNISLYTSFKFINLNCRRKFHSYVI